MTTENPLPDAPAVLAEYSTIRADIAAMAKINRDLVFDYNDPVQNRNARSHIAKMREKKADVERRRKDLKAGILEKGRLIDSVAKQLTADIEGMIEIHYLPIKAIDDAAAEAYRIEQARIEADRIAAEQKKIADAQAILDAERIKNQKLEAELAAAKQREREAEIARIAEQRAREEAAAAVERERQQSLQAARAHIEAERREVEQARAQLEAAKNAEQQAKVDQAAAVQAALDEAERKRVTEKAEAEAWARDAAAKNAARMKRSQVRARIVGNIADQCLQFGLVLSLSDGKKIGEAILDGKITGVSYTEQA